MIANKYDLNVVLKLIQVTLTYIYFMVKLFCLIFLRTPNSIIKQKEIKSNIVNKKR